MLSGLRVLDLSDESGLLAGQVLGKLGADVVKRTAAMARITTSGRSTERNSVT